jgi:hypothetical protein
LPAIALVGSHSALLGWQTIEALSPLRFFVSKGSSRFLKKAAQKLL